MTDDHRIYMRHALDLAGQALDKGEFPVGCVVVYQDRVIARGQRTGTCSAVPSELEHAEMIALRQLEGLETPIDRSRATLYATLEPCLMCYGAVLLSGIGTLVYAYEDAMGGGTACDRSQMPDLYRKNTINIVSAVGRQESLDLFKAFFSNPEVDYWPDSLLADYTLAQK